jgi:single-strand DNA-binding protein
VNTITVIGNIGKEPDVRFNSAGKAIATFSVATTFGKDDNKQTTWHDVVCFGEQAEQIADNLVKGCRVIVVGRLNKDTYEAKDGTKRTKVEIVADDIGVSLRWPAKSAGKPAVRQVSTQALDEEQPF